MKHRQSGFTLVEIAIVLVIIGLLLGGILKGQELISSARVRNLADLSTGTQAAYFGFIDRYRRVPGDMTKEYAEKAIGGDFDGNPQDGANQNGRLDPKSGAVWREPNAAWEQLSKAGFIQGEYQGDPDEPTATNNLAPSNPFNGPMLLGITSDYFDPNTGVAGKGAPLRMHLVMGRGVPVHLVRELDVKMDDGMPSTGIVRASPNGAASLFVGKNNWGGSDTSTNCVVGTTGTTDTTDTTDTTKTSPIYNAGGESLDCNAVLIF